MLEVTDFRSNPRDQIAHAVEVIGGSRVRLALFKAVYRGKKKVKTVYEVAETPGLTPHSVLTEGHRMADNGLFRQVRMAGATAYEKDKFFSANKNKIIQLAKNKKSFAKFHTKTRPAAAVGGVVNIKLPVAQPKVRQVTVDDIESFALVREHKRPPLFPTPLSEAAFKKGVARILGETGKFQDWGGETNDLYTTRTRLDGRRVGAAFAFKGPGKRGILTPAKMGKHANQIQRLFRVPAELYVVQYWAQIGEDVVEQLKLFAIAKAALEGVRILYAVIDGDDTARVIAAYPGAFNGATRRRRARRKRN